MPREHVIGILCMIILYAVFFYIFSKHVEHERKKELMNKSENKKGDV